MTLTQPEAPAQERVELCGMYRHAVDPKGRVAVPAVLRRGLPEGSVIAPAPDHRLVLYPPDMWHKEQTLYRRLAEDPSQQRVLLRRLSALTFPLELDAQGRLLLTAPQRTWAGVEDTAVFVGIGTGVEVVGAQIWNEEQLDLDADEFTRLHDVVHRSAESANGAPQ